MRARRIQTIEITSGNLYICDPGYYFEPIDVDPFMALPPEAAWFNDFGGDGCYRVYSDGTTIVVDTAPRQFKSATRPDFRQFQQRVPVDSGTIAFLDADHASEALSSADRGSVLLTEVPAGQYKVWEEEKDTSWAFRRRILCIGPSVNLFLHGSDATDLMDLEREIALTLRSKGKEKTAKLEELRNTILEMHNSGVRDRRLRDLAKLLRIKLPKTATSKHK